jgi:prepilin-type N-terminal cleavage/methylation domain-containing protein
MKRGETGFTMLEILISMGLVGLIITAASAMALYVIQQSDRTNDNLAASFYAETAGYWMTSDVRKADVVTTDNLTSPTILVLAWTDWGYSEDSVYHEVTYSISGLSGNIGQLKRYHQDSAGTNEEQIVSENIYYNPSDPTNTTLVTYQDSVVILKVTTQVEGASEMREYKVHGRPDFR